METMEPDHSVPTVVSVSGAGRRTRRVVEADIVKAPPPVEETGPEDEEDPLSVAEEEPIYRNPKKIAKRSNE